METESDDKKAHPAVAEGKTRTCTKFGVFFMLAKNKGKRGAGTGSWVTIAAIDHAKDVYPETISAEYIEAAEKLKVRLLLFCVCCVLLVLTPTPRLAQPFYAGIQATSPRKHNEVKREQDQRLQRR